MKLMEIEMARGPAVVINPFKVCSVESRASGKAIIRMSDGTKYKTKETLPAITNRLTEIGKEGGGGLGHGSR